jgi:hypothetical protein
MNDTPQELILGMMPTSSGFGFVLFEGLHAPLDWGVRYVKPADNRRSLRKLERLIAWYAPDVLVVEAITGPGASRSRRVRTLTRAAVRLADRRGIKVCQYTAGEVHALFRSFDAQTKYERASTIAHWLPALRAVLPAKRKIWLPENPRMSIFDAVALVLTHYNATDLADETPSKAA